MESDLELERPLHDEEDSKKGLNIYEFIRLYNEFVTVKNLEGLGERTIKDYLLHIKYLTSWLDETETDKLNRYVEKGIFLQYIGYMLEKEYKPCTINIRLRTLKCYLRWLCNEKYIAEDIASKLKLVKVPKDSIEPLNPQEIKKIIRTLNLQEYSQLRDFCLMVLILDTGVRINEACNLLIDDFDVKNKTIKIRSEIAKNREARILPVSSKRRRLPATPTLILTATAFEEVYQLTYRYEREIKFSKLDYVEDGGTLIQDFTYSFSRNNLSTRTEEKLQYIKESIQSRSKNVEDYTVITYMDSLLKQK